jgi:hypothetical protein
MRRGKKGNEEGGKKGEGRHWQARSANPVFTADFHFHFLFPVGGVGGLIAGATELFALTPS